MYDIEELWLAYNFCLFFLIWFWIVLMFVDLVGSNVRVNLSANEIRKLADRIISESTEVHDAVASVPIDKVIAELK